MSTPDVGVARALVPGNTAVVSAVIGLAISLYITSIALVAARLLAG